MKLGQLQIAALLVFSLASIGVIVAQNMTAENATANVTIPVPTPPVSDNATNETTPTPVPTPILSPTPVEKPNLDIQILYPQKITRNSLVTITANITNSGNAAAKNLAVNWKLPDNFTIITKQENCVNLEPNSACTSEITVQTSLSTKVGPNSVKLVVNYE